KDSNGGVQCAPDAQLELPNIGRDPELHERLAAQDRVGAAEEGSIPTVLTLLDRPVEQRRLAPEWVAGWDIEEPLRCLDERHVRILEVADGPIEDLRPRNLVGVQDHAELAARLKQSVVQIAGLRVAAPALPLVGSYD